MARKLQISKPISKSISECLELFIKHCQSKNLSQRTIKTYQFECTDFIEWYGADKGIAEVTSEIVGEYILHIQQGEISQTYVSTKLRQKEFICAKAVKDAHTKRNVVLEQREIEQYK